MAYHFVSGQKEHQQAKNVAQARTHGPVRFRSRRIQLRAQTRAGWKDLIDGARGIAIKLTVLTREHEPGHGLLPPSGQKRR
jgi:hypothetical protein